MSENTLPAAAIKAAAKAIHRYDWGRQLSTTSAPNEHHRAEAVAALSAAYPFLVREAQEHAWEEGHTHCFHVENPNNKERNPYSRSRS